MKQISIIHLKYLLALPHVSLLVYEVVLGHASKAGTYRERDEARREDVRESNTTHLPEAELKH
jgi:hypothetical protein